VKADQQKIKDVTKKLRKPKSANYFGKDTEDAIVLFKYAKTDHERNKLFNERIYIPLTRLVESILNRYKLYANEDMKTTIEDCIAFAFEKIKQFDETKKVCKPCKLTSSEDDYCACCGKKLKSVKAYSYLGTVVKRYLISSRIAFQKQQDLQVNTSSTDEVVKDSSNDSDSNSNTDVVVPDHNDYEVTAEKEEFFEFIVQYLTNHKEEIIAINHKFDDIFGVILLFMKEPADVPIYNKKALYVIIRELTGIKNTSIITEFFKVMKNKYEEGKKQYYNS